MIACILSWVTRHRALVAVVAVVGALGGELARRRVVREAIPELTDPQVVIVAEWMGRSAAEVAAQVTNPLIAALDALPGATAVRGSAMPGMALVEVVFHSEAALGPGRAEMAARLRQVRARLPRAVRIDLGPEASSTGWVFEYALTDPSRRREPFELRRIQEEVVRPALSRLPGVAEVASLGGAIEELAVEADPDRMRARRVAFSDLASAVQSAADDGAPLDVQRLESRPIGLGDGRATKVGDVARARLERGMPSGLADYGGSVAAVGGIVIARRDADVPEVVASVLEELDRLRGRLPPGVELVTVYDRSHLALEVEKTLVRALGEEIVAVVVVILVFLLHGRSAAVPLVTLPLIVLLTFAAMWLCRIPASVMSLGGIAIALGLAVDADVVALEACHRSLGAGPEQRSTDERRERLRTAAATVTPAIVTSLVIAALSFLPVFVFTGETGRLFRPLALTKTFIILAAAAVAITVAPVLRDRLVGGRIVSELGHPLGRWLVRLYRPMVGFALARPALTLVTAGLAVVSCLPIALHLGGEFLPSIDEGDLLFMPTTEPGVPPHEAAMQLRLQDRAIVGHDEVATVFGKVGRAETATDPAPFSMAETTIELRPRSEWPLHPRERWYSSWAPAPLKRLLSLVWPEMTPLTTAELVARLDRETRMPGWSGAWTKPARARMDMTSTGVRTPVAVRIVARDATRLEELGRGVRSALSGLPGTGSVVAESAGGESRLRFAGDGASLARYGVDPGLAASTAELVVAGGIVADGERAGRRYRLRLSPSASASRPIDRLGAITIRGAADGAPIPIPLELLGNAAVVREPGVVRAERGRLTSYVHVTLSAEANVLDYIDAARRRVDAAEKSGALRLGSGEAIEWAGQYKLVSDTQRRLRVVVPIVALSMLLLLLLQFRSLTEAAIVLASVPFALVGSVWTLYLLGYPLSAPVWVGLLSVVGLAMQTGVVMVVYIDQAFHARLRAGLIRTPEDIADAHAEGTIRRLRPKLMTVTTMAAGLLPLLWAEGAGAEIMKRTAAPMLGGLATSAFLTLEVLPVLYTLWRTRQLRRASRAGLPLAEFLGRGRLTG